MADVTAVELRGICRRHRDTGFALHPTTLTVDAGELAFITGRSGSGKTTLMNLIGLLDRPDDGSYLLFGRDMSRISSRAVAGIRASSLGFVFQSFHLLAHRPVWDNVQLGGVYAGLGFPERKRMALEILDRLGLSHRAFSKPALLSGGERQRVAIARALIGSPRLILCDEPTGNLDEASGRTVMELLAFVRGQGVTVIVVTHDLSYLDWGDRVFTMSDGHVAEAQLARPASSMS